MAADLSPVSAARPSRWAASATVRRVAVVGVLSVLAAAALNPIFVTPFALVLGRTLFVGMTLLLAFTLAGMWQPRWLPRWLAQALAVVLAAPLATFSVYLLSVEGDVAALFGNEHRLSGLALISATALIVGLVTALGALYREREAQVRSERLKFALEKATLERQALDARLGLLHAQIEPHFLFNTLANVQALVESGSERAAPVLRHLIAYLRAAMPRLNDTEGTLATELQLVRAYLELMQLRMPDRLRFEITVATEFGALRFPTMALLTLVENAVRHGIDPSEQGGRIELGARRDCAGSALVLWVQDSGVGLAEHAAPGTGLANLRARLQAFYGTATQLDLIDMTPHGLRVEIVIADTTALAPHSRR